MYQERKWDATPVEPARPNGHKIFLKKSRSIKSGSHVPGAGLEPARPNGHKIFVLATAFAASVIT